MRLFRCFFLVLTTTLIAACSNSTIPQRLDSFVDNAELKSSDYDAEDWQKSMSKYERLLDEYSNSGKEYSEAEKQMAARAMGRYHSLLLQHGIKQSADYLIVLKAMLPPYLEGLLDGLEETSPEIEKDINGLFDIEELEKAADVLEEKLERLFGGDE